MRFAGIDCPGCANHNGSSAQTHSANFRAAAITMRFRTSENPCCGNHNGSSAQRHVANIRAAAITMRFRTSENPCCANHNGSSAQSQWQPLLQALDTAPATRKAASGDNARHSPFWILRLPRGRQPAAPAATTRATAPSGGSGYCACHEDSQRHQRRQRAPQPLLEALGTAPATKTASGTSGDNARRSPFWRLWVLRLPRGRQQAAPAATTRAAAPSGGSGHCACHDNTSGTSGDNARRSPFWSCHEDDNARRSPFWRLWVLRLPRGQPAAPAATTRAAAPSGGSGYCACRRKTASGTSGDNARRSPFWRLWVLRLPRGQPAAPAATTRAAAPSGGSGYCACHEDSQRHQRRQRAPQPLLEALDTAPAARKTASGTSGDNARRSPFWRLWILRLPRGRQQAAPAATTRAAAPSGGSGYCACHEDSKRHQRRQRAPQPLLEVWIVRLPRGRQPAAPAATTRAAGPSGGSGYCPAATTRAAGPSGGSGYCACHAEGSQRHQRRQRAPQALLEALDTAAATRKAASGDNARRRPFWRLWILRLPRGRQPAAPAATTRAAAPSAVSGDCAGHCGFPV